LTLLLLLLMLLVTYLMATMTLGTLSICMTVIILNVHHRGASQRMPGWLRRAAFVYLARLLCVKIPYSTHQAPHHLDVSRLRVPVTRNGLNLQEWILTEDKNGEGWTFRE